MGPEELSGGKVLRDDYLMFHGSINTPNTVQPNAVGRWLPERRASGDRQALYPPGAGSWWARAEGPSEAGSVPTSAPGVGSSVPGSWG